MSDPYRPPSAAVPAAPTSGHTLLVVIGVACAALTALVPTLIVPSFRETFRMFGAESPWPTQLLLQGYPALWILPVLVLLLWRVVPWPRSRAKVACAFGVSVLVVGVPACMAALYLPIFALSQTL